jgi:hypothetical protein
MNLMSTGIRPYEQIRHIASVQEFSNRLASVSEAELRLSELPGFMTSAQKIYHCILMSTEVMTLEQRGHMVGLCGYTLDMDSCGNTIGIPWFLYTRDLVFTTELLKRLKALMQLWVLRNARGVPLWANRALASHKPTLRWLRYFGFTIGQTQDHWTYFYMKGGADLCAHQ